LPKDFNPETYFCDCYGIIHNEKVTPTEVQLKISDDQAKYLRALPLHHSQKEIETTTEYSVFKFYIKPTFDFRQQILSLGEDVEVISPIAFREEIKNVVMKMNTLYLV